MHSTRYLIVGGGMTGDMAAKGIRDRDPDGRITLVGAEPHPPYKRPPLSKGLWKGAEESTVWRQPAEGVELRTGRRVVAVDLDARRATDDRGEEYAWEKLLLATGARPREIPGAEGVVYFRTLDDYRFVRERAVEGARFVVIGGGFIGSELAAALHDAGCRVTMVFPEPGIGHRLFPADLSAFVTDSYRERGVEVLAGETVSGVEARGDGAVVRTGSGRALEADGVVAGLGVLPATELAEAAGLPVDDGIVVDEYGRVDGREDVWAAGDVASFPVPALGTRMRIEHEDHANSHGRAVGANMAGAGVPYEHLPLFYSDLFDLGYEAVGAVDSRLETVERWLEPNRKGVVGYVDEERRPRGVLLWNVWDKADAARELIRAGRPVDEEALAV
ncbi:MAG: FAD-dependent oxidoreductase [Thermoleophilia bacterium]|nr:FAD-dependent oxidoreductase [Thermoleophilia bacterium]